MKQIKDFVVSHFENFFVLGVLILAVTINLFVAQKLAFLNVYYLPVLLAAYYLDLRRSILGAVACIMIAAIYLLLSPRSFDLASSVFARSMSIFIWGCFLLLTAVIVGDLNQKLRREFSQTRKLNQELLDSQGSLEQAKARLEDYANNLESKVADRTASLEQSKLAIEELKKRVEDALYSTMDPAVVKMIIEKRLRTEKRNVSILFADLKGFTHYSSEKRPETVITDLNRFLGEMEEVLLSYHAHIDKYMGDGIMVEFGAPVDYERHSLMAVLAGIKMQQRMSRGRFPWQMRVGIASGEPIIGLVGNHKQSYTAIGSTVNLASRIEHLCAPGEVTVGPSVFEAVRRWVNCRRKVSVSANGEGDPKLDAAIEDILARLDKSPDDPELIKKAGWAFLDLKDPVSAHDYLKRALELDPKDGKVKMAYAEASMARAKAEKIAIRGIEERITLYEVVGIKNSLLDREKISQKLFDAVYEKAAAAADYPEDLVLPVECLDGTIGHSRVVGLLAFALAEHFGLPDQEIKDIVTAGYLADIGKGIIPHHILNRQGSLSKAEFEEVGKHSVESVRLLKTMGFQTTAIFEIIEASHENAAGGYPQGLSIDKIPLGARIVSAADAYDAMTSWRPYRDRWDARAAYLELLKETKKGKFDRKVVEALGKLLDFTA